jgi:hypothetical protein
VHVFLDPMVTRRAARTATIDAQSFIWVQRSGEYD